jgi:hypothetical protein
MSRWLLLLCAAFLAVLAGCPSPAGSSDDDDSASDDDDAASDDDDTASGPFPLVAELDPGQNEPSHPGNEPVRVSFNIAPDAESTLDVFGPGDVAVDGTLGREDADRALVFTPSEDLMPETSYTVRLSWNHPDSPLEYSFGTNDDGSGLDDPPDLVGRTWLLDLRNANITEPDGIGGLLDGFLPDEPVVIGLGPNSDFAPSAQPGVHVHGAIAGTAEEPFFQDPCLETFPLTYGTDDVLGTLDDRPADFDDPGIVIGPSVLSIEVQNVEMNLSNLIMSGFWTTDLSELVLDTFTAVLDTRTLSEAINPAGGLGVACDLLLQLAGAECETCADGEPYCIDILAEDMVLPEQTDQLFAPRGCADIIGEYDASGACPEAAASYDPNGGGFYELCPDWTGR